LGNRKLELPSSNSSKLGKLELAKFKVVKVRVGLLMHTKQKTQVSLDIQVDQLIPVLV
jgi:hypothetical protein